MTYLPTFVDKTADNWKTPKGSWVVRKLQSKGSPYTLIKM